MEPDRILLENTPDCVIALCARANILAGCKLRYESTLADGRFMVVSHKQATILVGTAEQLADLITAYEGGYLAAKQDAGT